MKNYLAPTVTISKLLMLAGALCALAVTSVGQTLNIYNVDASQFPRVTASYVALDNDGTPSQGLTADDFEVVESQRNGPTSELHSLPR